MENSLPPYNANIIQNLMDEGAIILAKANMAEFAMNGMNTNSSRLGQTKNAYGNGLKYTPYGSSGGPETALTASFGVIGLGTDTDGSISMLFGFFS